jgi:Holliday junction resolvase
MPPLESSIVRKTFVYLNSRGGFWVKIHGSPMQIAGLPDIIGCYRGRFVSFEVKRPGKNPTKLQAFIMKRITAAGGIATVIRSVEEARDQLNQIDLTEDD